MIFVALGEPGRLGQPGEGLALHTLTPWTGNATVLEVKIDMRCCRIEISDTMDSAVPESRHCFTASGTDRFF